MVQAGVRTELRHVVCGALELFRLSSVYADVLEMIIIFQHLVDTFQQFSSHADVLEMITISQHLVVTFQQF